MGGVAIGKLLLGLAEGYGRAQDSESIAGLPLNTSLSQEQKADKLAEYMQPDIDYGISGSGRDKNRYIIADAIRAISGVVYEVELQRKLLSHVPYNEDAEYNRALLDVLYSGKLALGPKEQQKLEKSLYQGLLDMVKPGSYHVYDYEVLDEIFKDPKHYPASDEIRQKVRANLAAINNENGYHDPAVNPEPPKPELKTWKEWFKYYFGNRKD